MNAFSRVWRNWWHGRKFAKKGKGCRFVGRYCDVDGVVELGDYCRIREGCIFRTRRNGRIVVGNRVVISWNCIIESHELVEIGEHAGISERVIIRDGTHLIYGTDANWKYTPHIIKPVHIGPAAWIGSGAYIGYGVTIGEGAVIGVHSVVLKDVPPYEIWAGVPAKKIGHRVDGVPPEKLAETARLMELQGVRADRRDND